MPIRKSRPGNPPFSKKGIQPGNPDIVAARRATRFAPGRSGNPGGRPPSRLLTAELLKGLTSPSGAQAERELEIPSDSTNTAAVAARVIRMAVAGNMAAINLLFDRIEGKTPKEVVFEDEKTQRIRVVFEDPPLRKLPSVCRELDALSKTTKNPEIQRVAEELATLLRQEAEASGAAQSSKQIAG